MTPRAAILAVVVAVIGGGHLESRPCASAACASAAGASAAGASAWRAPIEARIRGGEFERSSADGTSTRGGTSPSIAQGEPRAEVLGDEVHRRALERGLAWLESAQERAADGSFPTQGARTTSAGTGPAGEVGGFAPVAVTALGALAWMAGGSAPERGPHGRACAAAIDWLVARTDVDPRSERVGFVSRTGDSLSRMHGHGFATLALAQACVMSPHTQRGARLQEALKAAVRCIESSQGVEGGWDYEPRKGLAHENSITITAVQALRAAKEAGVDVDRSVIARAVDYVSRTQKPDGSFRYALGDSSSSVALTAAAISTFQMTGTYEGRPITDGYDFLARRLALRASSGEIEGDLVVCPYYERFYLAQAMWQHLDTATWTAWWRAEAPRVLATQREDGSWSDPRFGDVYATAMNCLVLAVPEGLLPIFQR
ncbi:MAG: terpene cyclase/mutase family protein [Planctomycetota bacterium]|nr:terpene cyclase/mutase family protein [Planctomycetota bacterium]